MAIDIFNPLKDIQGNQLKTANWYKKSLSRITDKSSPCQCTKESNLLARPSAVRMSMV